MEKSQRLQSIDALRGFDMLFIAGLSGVILSVCALFPNGENCWLAQQMYHCSWDGITQRDTIFPLFLFISGITFPFSYGKQLSAGVTKGRIYHKVILRGLVLCLLGIVYNGALKNGFDNIRFASVLGRIGCAWMLAAIIYMNTHRASTRLIITALILVGYWAAMRFIPVPDAPEGAGPFTFEGNLCGYVDRMLLPGRLHRGTFDPEGILGVVPAIATAMLGMLTGEFVRLPEEKVGGGRKLLCMLGAAALLLVLGLVWSRWFPLNKALWSSTFVLVVGAYSLALFAIFYWIIDVRGWRKWAFPLRVVGMNSIAIYMIPQIFDVGHISEFFFGSIGAALPKPWADVVLSAAFLAIMWLFTYFLYRRKIFLKV